jgi:hypothetical protein
MAGGAPDAAIGAMGLLPSGRLQTYDGLPRRRRGNDSKLQAALAIAPMADTRRSYRSHVSPSTPTSIWRQAKPDWFAILSAAVRRPSVIDRNRSHDEATRAAARGADARVATSRLTSKKSCARISRGTLSHGLLQAFAAIGGASRWVAGATIVARSVVLLEVLPEGRSVSAIRADSQKTACRRGVRRE